LSQSLHSSTSLDFLKSAFSPEGKFISNQQIIRWMKEQNSQVHVQVKSSLFSKLEEWYIDENMGSVRHKSGRFFSIDGIDIKTNWGSLKNWQQPIINQPEVGYLGFIAKEFDGILYFLMQAKIEPGNVNNVQLSPTLQATRSNYTQVHKGKKPAYLEYFQQAKANQILLDQLQSEQGARFLRKRNRNIIIKVDDDIPVLDNFVWLTLGQIKNMMHHDDLINMDSRTVISGITFGKYDAEVIDFFNYLRTDNADRKYRSAFLKSALTPTESLHSVDEIISYITHYKSVYDLEVSQIHMKDVKNWVVTDEEIYHIDRKFFRVIPVDVQISNREVVNWSQPMVQPAQEGLCAFVCKEINGIIHFAVQVKMECGNHDIVELAPTVQCLTGNYRATKEGALPFLDYVLSAKPNQLIFDTLQSEEGGRFYREQNRNMIVMAGDEVSVDLPGNYYWMTLNQLYSFLKFNNYLNIQARSLIAAISFS
jgi:dTDP-4-dehydro-6-deoxy-alpha-D-glucopyranose 2,3-dehydratase